ncbi:dihydroorotate dehydrogenase [Coniochaeta pulveracea]|uniref:Dihydroorotate dehydrogenase (fumarate) n=1 Tax=Coniochaeta pulveracea TaxID=177199 RepID=A0A420YNH8_9PEZI|nr:dihydroorotate dehydrogenase [Coniochaeta pulveracea]
MAAKPPTLDIDPPLLNSANPWATTLDDLRALYACQSTGAVTTRTSIVDGFGHDPEKHQYIFFNPADHTSYGTTSTPAANASLNSLGYSPLTLETYLGFIKTIAAETPQPRRKWFIVSVTGTVEQVVEGYKHILSIKASLPAEFPLAMEINLSCPNIPGKPPPAYSSSELAKYLAGLAECRGSDDNVPIGLKVPPYTHAGDFNRLVEALADTKHLQQRECPVSFLTSTNTLGSCLVLGNNMLPGSGMGGMAGAPLHPLALGNVATLRKLLDERPEKELKGIQLIGVGGVSDADGYRRMRTVGATAVGVGTALGLKGVNVFREIESGLEGRWEVRSMAGRG